MPYCTIHHKITKVGSNKMMPLPVIYCDETRTRNLDFYGIFKTHQKPKASAPRASPAASHFSRKKSSQIFFTRLFDNGDDSPQPLQVQSIQW
jgi:hypothetical protein